MYPGLFLHLSDNIDTENKKKEELFLNRRKF